MYHLKLVITAIKAVFKNKVYFLLQFFLSLAILLFLIYIPVKNIPGNTFSFQISIFTFKDWMLLIILSVLTSLSLAMNLFVVRRNFMNLQSAAMVGQGGFGVISGIVGSIFGSASCSACVGSIFGFLGVGGIFFLLKYRLAIVVASIAIMLLTLYYISKKVVGICKIK